MNWNDELIDYIFLEFLTPESISIPQEEISTLLSLRIVDNEEIIYDLSNLQILKYIDEPHHDVFKVPQFKIAYKILGG